jgi:hypothetical protein
MPLGLSSSLDYRFMHKLRFDIVRSTFLHAALHAVSENVLG